MVDIRKRDADRLRFMNAVFDAADGSTDVDIDVDALMSSLALSTREIADVCAYLSGQGLLECDEEMGRSYPVAVQLTHQGVVEVEASRRRPSDPTEHLPPQSVVQIIHGDVIGSNIATGSTRSTQTTNVGDIDMGRLRDFTVEFDEKEPLLHLDAASAAEARAEVETLKAQLGSPNPKHAVIRESVQSLRAILQHAAGAVAASELLLHLSHIH